MSELVLWALAFGFVSAVASAIAGAFMAAGGAWQQGDEQ